MAKAVFTTKVIPTYDDLPEVRYHFPRTYLAQATSALGDWIVYYEPRRTSGDEASRGGRQSYFAIAKVAAINPDLTLSEHYYAQVIDYMEFDHPVPFRRDEHYLESALMRPDGKTSKGAFGRSVRVLPDQEFDAIVRAGFAEAPADRSGDFHGDPVNNHVFDERRRIEVIFDRAFRDEAFRRHVRRAYGNRCAISGIELTDDQGRPEVHAAHIRPVSHNGPDSVRNGIALSATIHWMFDHGLLTAHDDFRIVCAGGLSTEITRLIRKPATLLLPDDPALRPHPTFLQFHRSNVFRG